MNKKRELAKSTIIIFIGTLCTKLVSFLLLPLYTGILTTSEYGTVDLLNTLITLLSPFIGLELGQALFRFLIDNRNSEENEKKYISSTFFITIINSILFIIIAAILGKVINNEYKVYLIINVIANLFSSLMLQISRGLGNNKQYSIASFLTAAMTICFNIIFLVGLKLRVEGMLLSTLIGYIIGIVYLFIKLETYKFISFSSFSVNALKKLLKYSFPLIPNAISWWVFGTSDRVIVSWILGLSYTGILSISYKFSNIYIILYDVFNKSWTESIAIHINDDDSEEYFNEMLRKIINFFASIGICLISAIPLAFNIMINENYNDALYLIPIAIIASIFQIIVAFTSTIYVAKNDTKAIAQTSIWSAVVNVSIHLVLIKFIGLYAAVVSTLCSYMFFAIYRLFDVNKRYIKIKQKYDWIIKNIIILCIVIVCYYSNNILIQIIGFIISIICTILTNKQMILELFKGIKNKLRRAK